jgi:large subunit ribosomal protein L17
MRHGKKINHLGRTSSHRKAMLANMACSLIVHKKINTTVAKAKALRTYIEPLITKSKTDSTHSRRTVYSYLKSKDAVAALFRDVAVKVATRPGGYTRILKTGNRLGDNAEMCFIELVDFNEFLTTDGGKTAAPAKKATRRSRGGAATKKTVADADATIVEETTNTPEGEAKPKKPRAKKAKDSDDKA